MIRISDGRTLQSFIITHIIIIARNSMIAVRYMERLAKVMRNHVNVPYMVFLEVFRQALMLSSF